jgi:hypothetical protein
MRAVDRSGLIAVLVTTSDVRAHTPPFGGEGRAARRVLYTVVYNSLAHETCSKSRLHLLIVLRQALIWQAALNAKKIYLLDNLLQQLYAPPSVLLENSGDYASRPIFIHLII